MKTTDDAGVFENDDIDLNVGVHQLDSMKMHEADVHTVEDVPAAVDADIETSEHTLFRP